jgi:putative N6-adenine-specific DNA methylase
VKLNLHISNDTAVLSLDSSGESLHKRGYRSQSSRAPLNEALAAGLLGLARYDGTRAFVDPMCGSGTLLIEAAQRALNYAPGLDRPHFNFMGWPDFDEPLWRDLVAQAQAAVRPSLPAPIEGSDLSPQAIGQARANLRAAGLAERIRLTQRDLSDFRAPECDTGGLLLCNPPYGERLGVTDELKKLYRRLGEVARRLPYGWRMAVFTEAGELADQIGLPVYRRTPLYNGPIECQLIILDLT